jgi:hypothetical protein
MGRAIPAGISAHFVVCVDVDDVGDVAVAVRDLGIPSSAAPIKNAYDLTQTS